MILFDVVLTDNTIQNCTIINNINTVTTTAAATGYTTALDLLRMGRVNII